MLTGGQAVGPVLLDLVHQDHRVAHDHARERDGAQHGDETEWHAEHGQEERHAHAAEQQDEGQREEQDRQHQDDDGRGQSAETEALETIGQRVAYDIRNQIYDHMQRLSYAYHDQMETGQIMSRSTQDVENVRMFFGQALFRLV